MGTKKKISLGDRASYFYIKNIKKWMFCPACKSGKMTLSTTIDTQRIRLTRGVPLFDN